MSPEQGAGQPAINTCMQMFRHSSMETEGSVSGWSDEMGASSDQFFFVSTYTDFEKLAHGPRGTEAKNCVYVYRFHPSDGSLVLLHILNNKEELINPAFSRFHPKLNVVYTCTEDIENNGQIFAYSIAPNGELIKIGQADAGGTSTCYLTIDQAQQNMLAVNYWNSTLTVIPLSTETGEFTGKIKSTYDPNFGKEMTAAAKKHGGVNHSNNDDSTIQQRQADPHSHALVLDPFVGSVAYVPDLGKDLIREVLYDKENGELKMELNALPSGLCTGKPDGPRYLEFHPSYETAYVVNELSSTIAVFAVDREKLEEIARAAKNKESMDQFQKASTLRLVQSISTVPDAFPTTMNTCGRVCVHPSGRFVIVSNRGHESICIFRIHQKGASKGKLRQIGFFHTRGETPRHFQFDSSGQYLIVANQDSDEISIFSFNLSSGEIKYTGNSYRVPSPNFVCCCPMRDEYLIDDSSIASLEKGIVDEGHWVDSNMKVDENKKLMMELQAARDEIEELKNILSTAVGSNTSRNNPTRRNENPQETTPETTMTLKEAQDLKKLFISE